MLSRSLRSLGVISEAFLSVVVITGLKLAIGHWLVEDQDALYLAAVAFTAWRRGLRAGVVAVVFSAMAQAYFFLEPRFAFAVADASELFGLVCWLGEGVLVCWLIDQVRKRASAQRKDLEKRLFHTNPLPMLVFDEKTRRLASVNEAAVELYGYERTELLAMHIDDLKARSDERVSCMYGTEQETWRGETKHRLKDGTLIDVEIFACSTLFEEKLGRLVTIVNRTEEHKLETQLRHAQKMDAIGQLAGGVAHDFNNMLTVMLSYASTALDDMTPTDEHYEAFDQIQRAAERSGELTRKLLTLGRKQPLSPKRVDLNEIVGEAEKLFRRLVDSNISFSTNLTSSKLEMEIDPGQVEQALMNLVVNARDAIEGGKGRIEITSSRVSIDAEFAATHIGLEVGRYAMIAVSDDGAGMDAATQARIFEPFFTTKDQGKGTGLGLSIVFGIVEQNGGVVLVESARGKGTTFRIYLPLKNQSLQAEASDVSMRLPQTGTETVLVVEDEPQVLRLVVRLLSQSGYKVLSAIHPTEALEVAAQHAGSIDLLLTDVVMPVLNGAEVAAVLREKRPDLKVIYTSGYTRDINLDTSSGAFLQKPVPPHLLRETIRTLLDNQTL